MSKTPKSFVSTKKIKTPPPPCVDLTDCEAIFHAGRPRNTVIRPILGGIEISSGTKSATLGLAYISGTGGRRLITAGHLVGGAGDAIGQPDNAHRIATVMGLAPNYQDGEVDVAKASVDITEINDNGIFGDIIDYWIDQLASWATENEYIQIEGAASGMSAGKVKYPYAQITIDKHKMAAGVATYESQGMDSGAPVIGFDGDEAIFYGLHGGRVQISSAWYSWYVPLGAFEDFL